VFQKLRPHYPIWNPPATKKSIFFKRLGDEPTYFFAVTSCKIVSLAS
jgi:hypothetical protein